MAGNYDDAPSRRMAIDKDGSVGVNPSLGTLGAQDMTDINSEVDGRANGAIVGTQGWLAILFPELREIDGIFAVMGKADPGSMNIGAVDTSQDTTNGWDGTWTNRIADYADTPDEQVYSYFRDNISAMAVATERGVKINFSGGQSGSDTVCAMHLYGVISPGETPDRILFLDTENSDAVFTKVLDYGDVPRGQTQVRTFKLKNNSASKTINTVQVTTEDLYLNAAGWYDYSDDDVSYQATFAVGNLGPSATKLLYIKQSIPDAETLGVQTARIHVSHASLT
jgi:hypothetical protein